MHIAITKKQTDKNTTSQKNEKRDVNVIANANGFKLFFGAQVF